MKMKSFLILILVIFSLNAYTQADRKFVRKGNGSYRDGNYQQAEVEYRKALEQDPSSYKADYNLGNAMYKQKQYDAAAGRYSALINSFPGPAVPGHAEQSRSTTIEPGHAAPGHAERSRSIETLSKYYYNLGNALYESQKYKESIDAYKQTLRNNPADLDAKHNLQLALKMLKEQEQQKNDQNQQGKDDKKDQQKQDQDQDSKDQDQQNKDSDKDQQQEKEQEQEQEQHKVEITPENAERILQALENQEKEVMKEVQERKERARKIPVEKNW